MRIHFIGSAKHQLLASPAPGTLLPALCSRIEASLPAVSRQTAAMAPLNTGKFTLKPGLKEPASIMLVDARSLL